MLELLILQEMIKLISKVYNISDFEIENIRTIATKRIVEDKNYGKNN